MKIGFDVVTKKIDPKLLKKPCSKAEVILANQIKKDTTTYVPMLSGSQAERAYVDGNVLVYPGPYARYLWAGKVMVNAATGKGPANIPNVGPRFPLGATLMPTARELTYTKDFHPKAQDHWFEASKRDNMDKWLRVAEKAVKNAL